MKKFIFTLGTTAILSAGLAGGASASGNDTYQVQKVIRYGASLKTTM